ncbi:hypothetical protein L3Y34_016182 [Caenorhabditis briggsae]|uniref:Uncharacterized protein n=1 Tax=Caenorhabditis briggsae TaxID=6238 RepID=A0AAE9DZG8_CAEBR|nr:hypothetical protein L3Y34_016182 [Caenorhabditis briggsae]
MDLKDDEMSPDALIRRHLHKTPIKVSAWEIKKFFEDESNASEEFLGYSLEKLAEIAPDFEETHKELVQELEKNTLLAVPMFREIPIMTLLEILTQCTTSIQSFEFFPDFPRPPATKLVDHIFPDSSLSPEEKIMEYEKVAKSTPRILEYLISWRDQVQEYVNGLMRFEKKYSEELNENQLERIDQLIGKSQGLIPRINEKIEQKHFQNSDSETEIEEFEKFYRVVSREPKYAEMDTRVARSQIQHLFDESNHDLRGIIARMGDSTEKEVKKEILEEEKQEKEVLKKKTANGDSLNTDFRRTPRGIKRSIIATAHEEDKASVECGRRKSVRFDLENC